MLIGENALDVDYTVGERRVQRRQIGFKDMVPLALQILQSSEVARNAVQQTYLFTGFHLYALYSASTG